MRLTFRAKLVVVHALLVVAVGGMVMVLLERNLTRDMRDVVTKRLETKAESAGAWFMNNRHPDKFARRLSSVVNARVRVVDQEGRIVADSDPDEVQTEHMAVAEGLAGDGQHRIRLSMSLADVDSAVTKMQRRLVVASLVGLGAALALAIIASRFATRRLREMIGAANRIARGDYAIDLPSGAPDEFGELAQSLSSLAKQLGRDMERIEQLERVRRDFVANVSHELRTPVTAIQGFSETLLDGEADAASTRQFLEAIGRHADRLTKLTSGLLRLSSLEARAPEDHVKDPVDVAAIAGHVLASATPRAEKAGKRLDNRIGADLLAMGDPLGVEQVLDNLLDNAIRYGGHAIVVEGERSGAAVVVRVIDNGSGIAAADVPRVFERFYRVTGNREPGTGLGLAIVKHLCEAMGGAIALESQPGRTSFEVTLPAARHSVASAPLG